MTLSGAVQFKTLSLEVLVLVGPLRPATLDMYHMFWCRWFQTQPLQVPSAIAAFPDVLLSTCVRHSLVPFGFRRYCFRCKSWWYPCRRVTLDMCGTCSGTVGFRLYRSRFPLSVLSLPDVLLTKTCNKWSGVSRCRALLQQI